MKPELRKRLKEIQKEIAQELERERERRKALEEPRMLDARRRLDVINSRLEALGLSDIFATGVHNTRLHIGGDDPEDQGWHPEVWICIKSGRSSSGGSETVVNELLDRLERG